MTQPSRGSEVATPPGSGSHPVAHTPTIWAASLAVLVAQMGLTTLAPLNGLIQTEFGASASQLTWLTAAVFVPTALFELSFGVLGDIFGRKRLMLLGLGLVLIGTSLGTQSHSVGTMALALCLLGLGAAVLLPSTLASVAEFSPSPLERAHALSRWALAISLGAAVSPLASGLAATRLGLQLAFLPVLVLSAVALVVVAVFARESRSTVKRSLDWLGQVLVLAGLMGFIYAIIEGSDAGFGSAKVVVALAVAVVALPLFVWVELRSINPMFQIRLLKIPAFAAAAASGLLGMLGFMGTAYAVAIKMGPIAHAAPMAIALPFVLIQLIPLLLAKWLPRLVHEVSPRILLAGGLVILAAGQLWLAALPDLETDLLPMAAPILLLGVGFIVMFTSLTAAAINSVPHENIGMASGATSLVRETGQAIGPAVVGLVALSVTATMVRDGLASSHLPPEALAVAHQVNEAGGAMALANAPLPPALRDVVAPIAVRALEAGFDVGLLAMAACSLLAALIVVVVMRKGAIAQAAPLVRPVARPAVEPAGERVAAPRVAAIDEPVTE